MALMTSSLVTGTTNMPLIKYKIATPEWGVGGVGWAVSYGQNILNNFGFPSISFIRFKIQY